MKIRIHPFPKNIRFWSKHWIKVARYSAMTFLSTFDFLIAYFDIQIGNSYANDSCLFQSYFLNLSLWLRIHGWLLILQLLISALYMGRNYIRSASPSYPLPPKFVFKTTQTFLEILYFLWILIGGFQLFQSTKCHLNTPELWFWAFFTMFVNTALFFGSSGGVMRSEITFRAGQIHKIEMVFLKPYLGCLPPKPRKIRISPLDEPLFPS